MIKPFWNFQGLSVFNQAESCSLLYFFYICNFFNNPNKARLVENYSKIVSL